MRWLYLYFPELQLDQLALQYPGMALAIACPVKHQILNVNLKASLAGVKIGQSVATAVLLCRDLQVFSPQPKQQIHILQQLAAQLYQVAADLAMELPDALLIRVSSMLKLYPNPVSYWQQLQQQLASTPYQYRVATGSTPLAAKLLARAGKKVLFVDPLVEQQLIGSCPLSASDLCPTVVEQLARVGIRQLSALQALPLFELARRFEPQVVQYLDRLSGRLLQLPQFYRPKPRFWQEVLLSYEISESQVLLKPLQPLLQRLQQFLQGANLLCKCLQLRLQFRQATEIQLNIQSRAGEAIAEHWQQLLLLHLAKLQLPEPVYSLVLEATEYIEDQRGNQNLLAARPASLTQSQLMSVLAARLGEQAIHTPRLQLRHWPEPDVNLSSGITNSAGFSCKADSQPQTNKACYQLRPLLLLARAEPLTKAVTLLGSAERLEQWCWQTGVLQQRDYYLARTDTGQLWWVFRTAQQQWFIHGWFS